MGASLRPADNAPEGGPGHLRRKPRARYRQLRWSGSGLKLVR
jgi:hypothetical protein